MAKLYWRIKREGKWTWKAVSIETEFDLVLAQKWAERDLEWIFVIATTVGLLTVGAFCELLLLFENIHILVAFNDLFAAQEKK